MAENVVIVDDPDVVVVVNEDPTQLVEETVDTVVVEVCQQGIPGPPGQDGAGVVQIDTFGISPAMTVNVDSMSASVVCSTEWALTVKTIEATPKTKVSKIVATVNSSGISHNVWASAGDPILYDVDVLLLSNQITLRVTNNEAVDIDVRVLRIATFV